MFHHLIRLRLHNTGSKMNKNFKKESRADLMPIRLTFPVTGPTLQTSSPTLFALDHATPATWPLRCFSKIPGVCTLFRSIASAIYVIRSRLPPCFVFRCYPLSDPLVDLLNTSYKVTYCVCTLPTPTALPCFPVEHFSPSDGL